MSGTTGRGSGGLRGRSCGLGGEVTFGDLFPDDWIAAHTEFPDVDAFVDASDYDIHEGTDLSGVPERDWDAFVARHTEFENWTEMVGAALESYRR